MAFGLSPRYIRNFPLNELSRETFVVLGIEAATSFGWEISHTSGLGFIAYTKSSPGVSGEQIIVKVENNTGVLKSICAGNQLLDFGKNKNNIETLITKINELKNEYTVVDIFVRSAGVTLAVNSRDRDILNRPPLRSNGRIINFFSVFKPAGTYFITPILLNINLLFFLLMLLGGANIFGADRETLIDWGANFRPVTVSGQWWRLLTNFFLHLDIIHLLMNMYALIFIGLLLEPYLGRRKFLWAYLLTGVAASVISLLWHEGTVVVGASGAIIGMYGLLLAMLTTSFIPKQIRRAFLTGVGIFLTYTLISGLTSRGVDNSAHLGGLLIGLLIGYAYMPVLRKPEASGLELSALSLLTVATLVFTFIVCSGLSIGVSNESAFAGEKHKREYQAALNDFSVNRSLAMEVFQLSKSTPKEKMLYSIKDRGIYYWNENITLIEKTDSLDLSEELHRQNKKIIKYCKLRIKAFELFYKSVDEETKKYDNLLDGYDGQLRKMEKELHIY